VGEEEKSDNFETFCYFFSSKTSFPIN